MANLGLIHDIAMDMMTWSPERKRFYEMYGYDIGPQVSSPMDAMRPTIVGEDLLGRPITEAQANRPTDFQYTQGDPSRSYVFGDMTAPGVGSVPKVKQVITETDDDQPNKRVTTIDWEQRREDEQRAVAPDFLNMTQPGKPPIRDRTFPLPMRAVESGIPGIGIAQGAEVTGPESLNPNDYSTQQLYNKATSRLQNFGKYGVDPLVTEATAGQAFGGNLPYSTEVAREGIIPERTYPYEQRVVDGPESPEMGIAPYTSFTPPVNEDLNQTMHAIMMAESGGDPNAHNPGTDAVPEDSLGLFQINWNFWGNKEPNKWGIIPYNIINNATKHILGRDLRREDLFNPDVNTAAAYAIQASEGFKPWSVYTSGAYKEQLPGLRGPFNQFRRFGERAADKVGSIGAGILDDATNIGQGVFDRAGQFAGQAVDFGQGLIDQSYGQQTQSTPEDIYKMQGIDTGVINEPPSKVEGINLDADIGVDPSIGYLPNRQSVGDAWRDQMRFRTYNPPVSLPLESPENVYEMQGIDTSVVPPVRSLNLPIPDEERIGYELPGYSRDDPYQFMEEGGAGRESKLNQFSRGVQQRIQDTAEGVQDFLLGEDGTIEDPGQDAVHWGPKLVGGIQRIGQKIKDIVPRHPYAIADELVDRASETIGEKEAREYGERSLLASDYQKGLLALTGEENAQAQYVADVANASYGESTDTDDKVVNDKDTVPLLGNDGTSNVTTNADAQREVNKIWAKFPQDIDSREEKYLHALKEMYKKAAILNVIASLTGQESMAPKFMELAAERFEKLEGFEGERRLANIAKVVFFREDGTLAVPPSKQAAFERAMKAGASLKEAQTISGYMDDEEKEKPKEWEPIQLQKTIGSLLNIPVSTPIAQSRALIAEAIVKAKADGNELEAQRLQNLSDEVEAFISKAKFGVPSKAKTPFEIVGKLYNIFSGGETFSAATPEFIEWLKSPEVKRFAMIDGALDEAAYAKIVGEVESGLDNIPVYKSRDDAAKALERGEINNNTIVRIEGEKNPVRISE
jgi:hypothetical protein